MAAQSLATVLTPDMESMPVTPPHHTMPGITPKCPSTLHSHTENHPAASPCAQTQVGKGMGQKLYIAFHSRLWILPHYSCCFKLSLRLVETHTHSKPDAPLRYRTDE